MDHTNRILIETFLRRASTVFSMSYCICIIYVFHRSESLSSRNSIQRNLAKRKSASWKASNLFVPNSLFRLTEMGWVNGLTYWIITIFYATSTRNVKGKSVRACSMISKITLDRLHLSRVFNTLFPHDLYKFCYWWILLCSSITLWCTFCNCRNEKKV